MPRQSTPETLVVKVDVIIAVYNAESTIEETVRSALHQDLNSIDKFTYHTRLSDEGRKPSEEVGRISVGEDQQRNTYLDVCICCYNDASTDKSLEILQSLEEECTRNSSPSRTAGGATVRIKLLIGTAPAGTTSRGAGYARNRAVELRDNYEKNAKSETEQEGQVCTHFLCILDSDDIMHSTRIAEQTSAMLSLGYEQRQKTLLGCQFDRIPKDSTQHYSQWANSLSDDRLYLEQFRECTLLQPTWFLSKTWFAQLGGYLEAPAASKIETHLPKRARVDPDNNESSIMESRVNDDKDTDGSDSSSSKQYYRLFHPSEILESTINKTAAHGKRKIDNHNNNAGETLRLAEDSRFFFAHLHAGGRLQLHRTSSPLVSYRHRSGMSQSSNTPRKLLLKLRVRAWEDLVFFGTTNDSYSNDIHASANSRWKNGFAIWGAGRDGKDFLKALRPEVASKVVCFVDVDMKKIGQWYDNPALGRRIPILHFSVLAKEDISEQTTFGRIDKKCGGDNFDVVSKCRTQNSNKICESASPPSKKRNTQKKKSHSVEPEVLQQLPVVVCVAMYRTNGALECNVASIGRIEGEDLWHIS
ncbi:hypothetical protein ACHAXR_005873 [Thalassiosira sp. AJA248-18]